jgi:bifunctional non-homologous end joining protein LigD
VVDPQSGTTKIELVRYYALVAPLMMEHLKGRPIAMVRAPDGIEGQLFFQKHLDRYKMAGRRAAGPGDLPGPPAMLEIASRRAAVGGADERDRVPHLERREVAIDKPDRMTFDIDPGEGVTWPQIQEARHWCAPCWRNWSCPASSRPAAARACTWWCR